MAPSSAPAHGGNARASSSPQQSWQTQTIARYAFGFALIFYAAAMFVWQHQHLSAQHLAIDFATRLSATKDAFLDYSPSKSVDENGNEINIALNHRPAHLILQNPKLPDWVKQYAQWHKQQLEKYMEAKRNNGTASDVQFLISRCLQEDKCGGASDRLQDMPYNLLIANKTRRVLLVRWEKPAPLENFLVPPENGLDWSINDELYDMLVSDGNWHLKGKEENKRLKIVSSIRRDSAAPMFRKYENDIVGHKIYHEIFRLLFAPSAALADRVHTTMNELGLVPRHYSSVHLRVKYPVHGIDEHAFTFQKHKHQITGWAANAVNCAAELHPNSTIYVSSDNNDTVGYLLEESHFAKHYIDATKHKKHPLVVKLVARDYSNEVQHVAFSSNVEADGFMNVFEDMMIMGMGKCVAHGVGGYGRLGAALSGGECAMAHRGRNSKMCSDVLAQTQSKIDS